MKIHWALLKWQLRTAWPAVMAAPVAAFWVLLIGEPLFGQILVPGLFILVHCGTIAAMVGRFRTPSFAYLYARGFSRQELFGHTMLAVVLLALAVWFTAAVLVWSGARAVCGDFFGSPYQPLMWSREIWTPLWWLAGYVCALPLCHYVWIRQAHQRARNDASWLVAAWVIVLFCFYNVPNHAVRNSIVYQSALLIGGTVVSGLIFWLSHRLYRQMEVGA